MANPSFDWQAGPRAPFEVIAPTRELPRIYEPSQSTNLRRSGSATDAEG